ncbi:hypothetical protein [Trueperella pecoris]|uniref:Uncharacterized protein n=1 Tax=Trueperella pecoris TaxID=2733571 RepID=A0A7M1QVI1_9ACTO|nr:hypothetical protein [Trueperella pecoris]QOR45948.1 hypothetical protein INS88_01600 [Trueperella pecoris]
MAQNIARRTWAVLLAFALTILGMGALTIVGSPSAHAATEGVVTVVVDTESEAEAIYHNTESSDTRRLQTAATRSGSGVRTSRRARSLIWHPLATTFGRSI